VRLRWSGLLLAALLCIADAPAADRSVDPIVSRIRRDPIESSGLAAVGYSKKLRALEIEFRDGLIYRYEQVPVAVYRGLMAAESKARYYNRNVRGKYHCVRVKLPRKTATRNALRGSSTERDAD
jgi:hypothetical protein